MFKNILKISEIIVVLLYLILIYFFEEHIEISILKIFIIIIYFQVWFKISNFQKFRKKGYLISYFYLLYSVFFMPRIIISLLYSFNFGETTWFYPIVVGLKTQIFTLNILFFNLLGFSIAMNFLQKYSNKTFLEYRSVKPVGKEKIYLFLYLGTFIFTIARFLFEFKYVSMVGYAEGMYGGNLQNASPLIIRILSQINFTLLPIILASTVTIYTKYIICINTVFVLLFTSLGGRATVVSWVLFLLWFIEFKYCKKISNKKKVLILSIVLIVGLSFIFIRNKNFSILEAFWIQGETIAQTHYFNEFYYLTKNKYGELILKLQPLLYIFRGIINKRISPFQEMFIFSAYVNQKGVGIGGNFLVDMYLLGKNIGVLILSGVYFIVINYIEIRLSNERKLTLFKAILIDIVINYLFSSSRQGYFYMFNFIRIIYISFMYCFLQIICLFFNKLKK